MGRPLGFLCGLLLAGCATISATVQCLPPGIPARATWWPVVTLSIPRCPDCQQVWATSGDTLVHAVIIRGLVGVVSAEVGGLVGPIWEDPGVLVPGIPTVRPQPEPQQSCEWRQLATET